MNRHFFAFALLLALAAPRAFAAPAVAPGFVVEDAIPGSHIEAPVALAFTPDGRLLVADVPGRVWVIENGVQLPTPMWAHENEVEINGDCGLLGMALDPAFATNRLIYLLYAVDPDSNGVDNDSVHFGRLVRYQVSATDPNRIDESTRTVLLGTGWADGVPNYSGTHSIGALQFGEDGTLLVSAGEGARYDLCDPGGLSAGLFAPGFAPTAWDRGAFRAQMLECPGGKILRLDPATGHGLPSNPFWDGDPNSVRSKVWTYGMRNPFRFRLRPGTGSADPAAGNPGTLYVGDVGWQRWEEVSVVTGGGANLGWPCREGPRETPEYPACAPSFGGCETAGPTLDPVLAFSHIWADSSAPVPLKGNAIASGPFYTHTQFPAAWRDRFVYGDFYRGWIEMARFDASDQFVGSELLASGMNGPVDFAIEPATGWLYVACIIDDHVRRIRWAPVAGIEPAAPRLALSPPSPNPMHGGTAFTLTLPGVSRVAFDVLDASGRRIRHAPETTCEAGSLRLSWDGLDSRGARVPPGLYFARVTAAGETLTRRVIALR
ncbi:MAG: PQQ-dependent sugar dehydrogenase [Candidatus Eisenbacteria bacterium]|nr:PQQ-dependent sugar dehydrogenase [Candidatus Eisenbacteria bacterium]